MASFRSCHFYRGDKWAVLQVFTTCTLSPEINLTEQNQVASRFEHISVQKSRNASTVAGARRREGLVT